jgi:alpha-amylase/alpha-mannosidase (GH57 family)
MSGGDAAPVQLILLWHMHQPGYGSPRARRPLLPWVRLHATKDYLDMAERLLARPGLAVTYNLVPSLVEQLAACEAGVGDPELDLALADPSTLDEGARTQAFDRLSLVPPWARERFPALALGEGARVVPSDAQLRDLQVLHFLAWIDPTYYPRPALAPLI